jgi:hypothetical protein
VVDVDEPIFQPEPREILFQDYEPLQILTKILKLRYHYLINIKEIEILYQEGLVSSILKIDYSK